MSVVILGGNECMERRYKDLCKSYQCQSKIFTKPAGGLRNKLGNPDLMIFFTNTMSHKMVQGRAQRAEGAEHHHRALPHELPVRAARDFG